MSKRKKQSLSIQMEATQSYFMNELRSYNSSALSALKRVSFLNFLPVFFVLILSLCSANRAYSQQPCSDIPLYEFDLRATPSKTLTGLKRQSGSCCSGTTNSIQFKIILGPNSLGVRFDLSDNSGTYTVNCVTKPLVDQSLCLTGAADGVYYVTYTKPGNDPNDYTLSAIPYLTASSNSPASAGSSSQLCAGSTLTLTANPNLTGATYTWTGPNGFTATGRTVSIPSVTAAASGTYTVVITDAAVCLTAATATATTDVTINARPDPPTSGGNVTICENGASQTLTANATAAPGMNIVWYDAATGGNVVSPATYTSTTAGSRTLYAETVNPATSCRSTTRTAVILTINPAPARPTLPGNVTVCENGISQTLTATASVPAGHSIVWYDAATGGNVVPPTFTSTTAGSATLYAEAVNNTTSCRSLSRTAVVLTINAAPMAPASSGNITQCETSSIQTLNANSALASTTGVTWYDAATGGSVVASPTLNTPGSVTYHAQYSNGTCSSVARTAVTLTINPAPLAPTLPGNVTVCENGSSQTLTATASVPAGHSIVWYDAATGGNMVSPATFTSTTAGSRTLYAEAVNNTTSCRSLARTAVTLTITAAPAAPTSSGNITQCETSPIQTLNANNALASNSGVTWYTTLTGNTSTSSPTLNTVGTVTYYAGYFNGSCSSINRTPVTLTITAAPLAPASSGNITQCETSPIQTLNANNALASTTGVTWYTASVGGSVIASPTLSATGTVTYYAQYSNGTCSSVSRTPVTLTINAAPFAPTLPGNVSVCENGTSQTLTATASVPAGHSIVWYDAATGGNVVPPTFTSTTAGSATLYAEAVNNTTSCRSLSRTAVVLTINAAPMAPASSGNITQCETSPIQTLNANSALASTTGVTWYDTATGGSVVASPTLNTPGSVTYHAQYSNGTCSSVARTAVTLTINPAPLAPTLPGNVTVCENGSSQTLTATASVPAGHSIVWYDAATGGNMVSPATFTSTTAGSRTLYAEAVNNTTSCRSLARTAVTLTITAAPAAPASSGNITQCETSPIQTLNANNALASNSGVTWYDAAANDSVVASPTLNSTGSVTYYAQYSNGTCSSILRTPVTLTITPAPPAPASSGNLSQCETNPIQTLNANSALASATGVTWYTAATGGTAVASPTLSAIGTVTYYAEYSNGTCSSVSRTPVSLTITPAPAAPASSGNITQCEASPIQTLNANDAMISSAGITWYTAASGGSVVSSPTLSNTGSVTYYAEYFNGTCSSTSRTPVVLTITPAPPAPAITASSIVECEKNPVQTLDARTVLVSQSGVTWYTAATGGTLVTSPTLSTAGIVTYYAQYFDGTCYSVPRTPVTLTITPAPAAPSVSANSITECEKSPLQTLDARTVLSSSTGVTWYTAATGGTLVSSPTLAATGTVTYYAEYFNGTCSSVVRTPVTLTITPAPVPPSVSANSITECEKRPVQTLDARTVLVSQNGVTWYTAATGGTLVTSPTLSATGTVTYYAQYFNGTCSSILRTPVTLTITPAPAPPAVSASSISECEKKPIQTLDARTVLVSQNGVTWYTSATGGTLVTSPTLSATGTVTYYAQYFDGTCSSVDRTPVILTITPAPPPPAVSSDNITQCQGTPVQTLDARAVLGSPAGVTWYTDAIGGSAVASPTLNTVGSVTYYAEAVNTAGCVSLTRTTVRLTIKALPAITPVNNVFTCNNGATTPIVFSSSLPGTTYTWTNSNPAIGLAATGTGNIPSFVATNTSNNALIARITVTPTANGCPGPSQTFTITVPKPLITNSPLSQEICSGKNSTPVTLTSNTPGATFQWSVSSSTGVSGQTALSGTDVIPTQTLFATGTSPGRIVYTITALANGCQGPSSEYAITVIPLPTQAETYGDPSKRYSITRKVPLKANTAVIGTGQWSQTSGPNNIRIDNPASPDTEISGHVPGEYSFKWTITNRICVSENALTLAVNAPPVAIDDSFDARVNHVINGTVATNDRDPDGTTLTFTQLSSPASGVLVFNPDGTFTYTPANNFAGAQTFRYSVCDADGECSQATVTLAIYEPTIVNLTPAVSEMHEGRTVSITATLVAALHEDVIVSLAYTGDAVSGSDYAPSGNLTILIKAGQTSTTEKVVLTAIKDDIKETDEYIFVDISAVSSKYVDIGTGAEVVIHDMFPGNDPPSGKDENPDIRPDPLTSPNEDGAGNETFFIYNISAYPDNEVMIFNRWGNEVFRIKNYDNENNAFRGKANRGILTNTQQDLVDGVYYYIINTKVAGAQKVNKGYIILKRKK
ncbi:Ig-like domain-containing protein [Paradesertivirga mongoliensis]|uniref:Ig-like domain-containing protein n=1 Tax=Paradesertivirga mongoliensis TaxID=2100740 RepID=A0ABW4ZH54_9SPHI|nr:gliding motility-associated C-terminal domain-containing protein [Pedobacter mongoliensis]